MELVITHKTKEYIVLVDSVKSIQHLCIYISETNSGMLRVKYYHKGTWGHLSRFITDAPKGMQVDHINGDTLDNRACNLRIVTAQQNCRAFRTKRNRDVSPYRGVAKNHSNWSSTITTNKISKYLGTFKTQEEAAHAYDAAAKELFGEFAQLNFP